MILEDGIHLLQEGNVRGGVVIGQLLVEGALDFGELLFVFENLGFYGL